jgi:NADH:ubiquinone oxidoreductase subunit F (NADH-binding)
VSALLEPPGTVAAGRRSPGRLLPTAGSLDLDGFTALYGARPKAGEELIAAVEAAGLTGRGGAGFPTARKLRAVRAGGGAVVVGNGTEGEPASAKDRVLMTRNPHLVLDGALIAAELVRARRVIVAVGRAGGAERVFREALASRRDGDRVEVVAVPDRFVAGEESALVNRLNGGEAKPTFTPPRPFERGVDRRPTLVQNVETLASLALVARYGPEWFRRAGTAAEPGTVLATVSGAVARPSVIEAPLGTPFEDLLARCGGATGPLQAYLVGGYFGRWVPAQPGLRLSAESLAAAGGVLGARVVVALPSTSCGVVETARAAAYLAAESARQCGPCLFGLRALADRLAAIARREPGAAEAYSHLARLERQIAGRGACAHPDGVVGFVAGATRVFAGELAEHLAGRCTAHDHRPVLPTPATGGGWR